MREPERPLAESLLALFAGRERAAAIYGDLTELAQTRGRAWFWIAYGRTLVSLTWRRPVAFASGIVVFNLLSSLLERWIWHQPATWRMSLHNAPLVFQIAPLLATVAIPLWFTFPYALVRYGVHDRFVRLATVTFLLSTGTFLFYWPLTSLAFALVTLLTLLAALLSATWRRPALLLFATIFAGGIAFGGSAYAAAIGYQFLIEYARLPQIRLLAWELAVVVSMFTVAVVCSSLHGRLLRTLLPGGTYAEPA